jgi:hypothetical protein
MKDTERTEESECSERRLLLLLLLSLLLLLLSLLLLLLGNQFTALNVPRQCPLVLLAQPHNSWPGIELQLPSILTDFYVVFLSPSSFLKLDNQFLSTSQSPTTPSVWAADRLPAGSTFRQPNMQRGLSACASTPSILLECTAVPMHATKVYVGVGYSSSALGSGEWSD